MLYTSNVSTESQTEAYLVILYFAGSKKRTKAYKENNGMAYT
jgi:hypothetical protein